MLRPPYINPWHQIDDLGCAPCSWFLLFPGTIMLASHCWVLNHFLALIYTYMHPQRIYDDDKVSVTNRVVDAADSHQRATRMREAWLECGSPFCYRKNNDDSIHGLSSCDQNIPWRSRPEGWPACGCPTSFPKPIYVADFNLRPCQDDGVIFTTRNGATLQFEWRCLTPFHRRPFSPDCTDHSVVFFVLGMQVISGRTSRRNRLCEDVDSGQIRRYEHQQLVSKTTNTRYLT